MARRVFYSFHFDGDYWRTQQVRNIGALEHDSPVSKNDWEEVKPALRDEAWVTRSDSCSWTSVPLDP